MLKLLGIIFLIFVLCNTYSQELPTILEVFDFNIGDEFHYKAYGGMAVYPHAMRVKIMDRIYDFINDNVKYTRSWDNFYTTYEELPEPHLIYHVDQYVDTLTVTLLDSTISCYLSIEENYSQDDTSLQLNSFISQSSLCGDVSYNFHWNYSITPGYGDSYGASYIKGLGRVSSFVIYESQSGAEWGKKMFYYNKGDSTCGIPDTTIITNYATPITENQISLFPNPCSDFISVQNLNPNFEATIRIFSLIGNLVFEAIRSPSEIIDVNYLQPGIYVLHIIQPQTCFVLKFQKI
jgi:hypothetical protein